MDPNIQTIILGLLTNGLTAFIVQFGRKDSKILLGEELVKKIKWEETALQPILQKAARQVSENVEWTGIPSLNVVCLFLTSPESESIVRQIYAVQFIGGKRQKDLTSIRKEFLISFYLYSTSYASNVDLKEDQLEEASNILFNTLLEGCEQALNTAIDEGKLSAHEAKSAFRYRLIQEVLDALDEKVTFLTSQQKPVLKDILAFEETYRRLVGNRHKYITPPNFGRARQLLINKLYVSPDVVTSSSEDVRTATEYLGKQQMLFETQTDFSRPYRKVLSRAFRMVLLGNPGGGKSTFAQKLCYDLITHYSERLFGGRRNITPIMVILRDYGPEKKNHNRSILEFIQFKAKSDYQLPPPPGAFEYLLLNGRALVIFDGLDELLDTRDRQEVTKAVEAFCVLYPSVPVLVTSREVGYEQAPLDEEIFDVFHLADFSEDQVQEYVKKWFDAITDISPEQRKQKSNSFLEESQMVPDLRTNPLMLALLCNVYQEENYIPTNRPDVYEKCANMLFERWDRHRGINVNLSFDIHLRPTMTYLAYWIYSSEELRGGVTEEKLIGKTTEYLREKLLEEEAQKVAREFIEFCKGRAWVFTNTGSTKHGEELFQFTHQTFLEYFTATYLCRKNPTPARLLHVLRTRIVKREWDVIAQLAFQKLNRDVEDAGDYLLSSLINQAESAGYNKKWNLLSFTVRCLEFMMPSPYVIQNIVSACIRHSFAWGIEHSNKLPYQTKNVASKPEEIFSYLLNAAPDNRRIIVVDLEDQLIAYAKSPNETEAMFALEIGMNLSTLYSKQHNVVKANPAQLKFKDNILQNNIKNYWKSVSDRITDSCSEQVKALCQKHPSLCFGALRDRIISLSDIVKWHGVESLFKEKQLDMLPSTSWTNPTDWLLIKCFSSSASSSERQSYLDELKQLAFDLLSITPPWIRDKRMKGFRLPFRYRKGRVNTENSFDLDADAIFGFFILSAVMVEIAYNRIEDGSSNENVNKVKITERINNVLDAYPHFTNSFRSMFYKRYQISKLKSATSLEKIQSKLISYNLNNVQQNFIWRWINGEIDLVSF